MNLGNNLFEARKRAGLSQDKVAEKLGITRQTISKWETNETIPDIYQAKRLSKLYNLSLDELIGFDIELKEIICQKSPQLICSTLKGLYTGELIPQKQCSEGVTIAKKFNKQDGLIDWEKTSESIHNQVRSMVDFPCAYTMINNKVIKILETRLTNKKSNLYCGTITSVSKDGIEINTGEGCILITKVKPESKGIMNAFDFANGAKIKVNMKVGE